jgi:oxygen-independent coproporphyrinogen-3 oxidase
MVEDSFSLYVHIPFCSKKCPYCHFFVTSSKTKEESRFIKALLSEWKMKESSIPKEKVITLYFGGGTPTELSTENLAFLIRTFKAAYPNLKEITVEGNPESISFEKIQALKEAGCNRFSIGVQSLVDHELINLKRQHEKNKAKEAIYTVFRAGIQNITIDLMYDIPGQTKETFLQTLRAIPELPITHLSLYNLVIEEQTAFKRIEKSLKKKMPNEQDSFEMLHLAIEHLEKAGLKRYEISAFAKEGFTSLHNTGYWLSRPFVGLGPSAFSDDGSTRSQNICHMEKYYQRVESSIDPVEFKECLHPQDRFNERFIVQLRMFTPLHLPTFIKKHGNPKSDFFEALEHIEQKGWINRSNEMIILTKEGADFFEEIAVQLI